jgi:hypothetical protein
LLPLNEPQRRHFAVMLASLEDALGHIESLARNDTPDTRLLTRLRHDVPSGFITHAAPFIASLRGRLRELTTRMSLDAHPESKERWIHALLTSQIVHTQDSYARNLGGYGAVDHRLASQLDPIMHSMETALVEIRAALRGRPGASPRDAVT